MREELYISLEKLSNKDISDTEIVILLSLNGLMVGDFTRNCINYTVLGYAIFGRKINQSEKDILKKYFQKLIDKEIIELVEPIDKSTNLCNVEQVFVNVQQDNSNKEYYVCITKTELHKMMNVSDKIDNYKLVRLFLWYINSLHKGNQVDEKYKSKIGYMPQSYLSSMAGINLKTLYKYDAILQEYQLLYIVNHKIQYSNAIDIPKITNTYSRYEDKYLCDEYAANVKSRCYSKKDLDTKVFKQTYSQKLLQYQSGKSYPLEELDKINQYVELYNSEIDKNLRKGNKIDNTLLKEDIKKMSFQSNNESYNCNLVNELLEDMFEVEDDTYKDSNERSNCSKYVNYDYLNSFDDSLDELL